MAHVGTFRRAFCIAALTAAAATAQGPLMQIGNVVHGNGGGPVALIDTALQSAQPIDILPPGLNCGAFTWDASVPTDLICWSNSNGLLYRTTVTSAGSTFAQLGTTVFSGGGGVVQMSWDNNGQLIVVGNWGGHVTRVDPISGATTVLVSWPFPSSLRCGQQDPTVGDYWLGNNQGIWRVSGVPSGSPSVSLVHGTSSPVTSLIFDPIKPEFLLFVEGGDLHRLSTTTLVNEVLHTGFPTHHNLRTDELGRIIASAGADLWLIPNPLFLPVGGVTPVLLGSNPGIGCCNHYDFVVIGQTHTPFHLDVTAQPGGGGQLSVLNTPPNTQESWLFVSRFTLFPAGAGPLLGIVPDGLTLSLIASNPAPQPGNPFHAVGAITPLTLPPGSLSAFVGETWDGVAVAFGPAGVFLGRTNVSRVTWQ